MVFIHKTAGDFDKTNPDPIFFNQWD